MRIRQMVGMTIVLFTAMTLHAGLARAADAPAFHLAKTLQVGGEGSWDYLTVDPEHKLLYVPRSTHTMVLDEADGKTVADIPGQKRNHGVAIVPEAGRGFITDGNGAEVIVFDLKSNKELGRIKADQDVDGVIYDPSSHKVLAVCGDPGLLFAIAPDVDPAKGEAAARLELGGKPEFLAADGAGKAYINLEDKDEVAVVDLASMKVLQRFPVAPGGAPVGMAMDTKARRLFIGCRKPQKLIVMNADDGKVMADLPIGAGVDAVKFDDGNIFASCRDGTLAVARETSPGKFEVVQTVQTKPGARTMGVDPMTHKIYLPTAEFEKPAAGATGRPAVKANSFMILVVEGT